MKLVVISGFLGSGKTTAISNASLELIKHHRKVGIITNDQGEQQVDSLFVQSLQIPTGQVQNGCFCCNYDQLNEHIDDLIVSYDPELIFAESVGSCTDLVATIAKPLAIYRPEIEIIIVVFADASLLLALLQDRASFINEDVRYIYQKQLEDADMVVINKVDTVNKHELYEIESMLHRQFPDKRILLQNSTKEVSIRNWLKAIEDFKSSGNRKSIIVDYDRYANGEAALGWLDKKIEIRAATNNAPSLAIRLINTIFQRLLNERQVVGHLKVYVESETWNQKLSYTLTTHHLFTDLSEPDSSSCTLLINARVQMEPQSLKRVVEEEIEKLRASTGASFTEGATAYFQPGYPKPTHRMA